MKLAFYDKGSALILDNFNRSELDERINSPLWFSKSTPNERHIGSKIIQSVSTTVTINASGVSEISPVFKSHKIDEYEFNESTGILPEKLSSSKIELLRTERKKSRNLLK